MAKSKTKAKIIKCVRADNVNGLSSDVNGMGGAGVSAPLPGSVADVVSLVEPWGRLAPSGLARIAYTSEFARQRVVAELRAIYEAVGVPFYEEELAPETPAEEIVRQLKARYQTLEPGVVSLSGLTAALPLLNQTDLVNSLRVLNFNRENLALYPLRQIWWTSPSLAEMFTRAVPDIDSWFIIRTDLTENVPSPVETTRGIPQSDKPAVNIEQARSHSAYLAGRFGTALKAGAPLRDLRQLAKAAVEALREGGAEAEARALEYRLHTELIPLSGPPKVFISYSHDSPEHDACVLAFADRLRADGIDATIDQYYPNPQEGWPLWMERNIQAADYVLLICTETYHRRVMREEIPGVGLGVQWEGGLIRNHIYRNQEQTSRYIPIIFAISDQTYIPTPLQGQTFYTIAEFALSDPNYEALYRHLTGQPTTLASPVGSVKRLPQRPAISAEAPLERRNQFWNVPPRNPYFTGREDVLNTIHASLFSGGTAALIQTISGLGGIGKTQTAVEYAYRYRDEYSAVLWLSAASEETLTTGFSEIARLLGLPESDRQEQAVVVSSVQRWLQNNADWLLILDNADDVALASRVLPDNMPGHVLITSRVRILDELGVPSPIVLNVMSLDKATDFLLARAGLAQDNSVELVSARELAQELGCLPLALEQAGAYIKEKQVRVQDYLGRYRAQPIPVLERQMPVVGGYSSSVAKTWALNFAEIEKNPASADILRISAFLAPEKIPLELFANGSDEFGPAISTALTGIENDPLMLGEILEPLARYSLIRRDVVNRTYDIHRLVQSVIKERMEQVEQGKWIERTAYTVQRAFPTPDFANWTVCDRLLPHAQVGLANAIAAQIRTTYIGRLANQIGLYMGMRGEYKEAEQVLRAAIEVSMSTYGFEHPDTATSLNNLADIKLKCGNFPEAQQLYERALAIREAVLGPNHYETGASINGLASVQTAKGQYKEAERLLRRALTIARYNDLSETAVVLSNLAVSLKRQGKDSDALRYYQEALHAAEVTLGPNHPSVAIILNNLGNLYRQKRDFYKAEPLLKRALDIGERALGPTHSDNISCLDSLAGLYKDLERFSDAQELYNRAIPILKEMFGLEHPNTATSIHNLGVVYVKQRNDVMAEPLLRQALAIREKILGPEHPDIAASLSNIATLCFNQKKYAEARPLYKRALAIREKILGPEHRDTLATMDNYANLLRKTGHISEADLISAQAVGRRKKHEEQNLRA